MGVLFNKIFNRQHTQLAYQVGFYPYDVLSPEARALLQFRRKIVLSLRQFETRLNDNRDMILLPDRRINDWFAIRWTYNNIPTEAEWDRRAAWSDTSFIHVEYRISPSIPENNGKIVLLSWF